MIIRRLNFDSPNRIFIGPVRKPKINRDSVLIIRFCNYLSFVFLVNKFHFISYLDRMKSIAEFNCDLLNELKENMNVGRDDHIISDEDYNDGVI